MRLFEILKQKIYNYIFNSLNLYKIKNLFYANRLRKVNDNFLL